MTLKERAKDLVQSELQAGVNLLKEDGVSVGKVAMEGLQSKAYIYPLLGVYHFARHPELFRTVQPIVYKSAVMSVIIVAVMFFFTYLPQVALLAFVSGPLAFIAAIPVVFIESWTIISFFNKSLLVSAVSEKVFDAVLLQKGLVELVERGRIVSGKGKGQSLILGRSLLKPISGKFSTEGLIRYILTIPLNAIPAVGTAFFLLLNGSSSGPTYHNRYFLLKQFTQAQKQEFVDQHRGAYTSFGTVALGLGMIPVVGMLFNFTSAAGAALFAADLEKQGSRSGVRDEIEPVKMGSSTEL